MKVQFELKNMTIAQANAFFAALPAGDTSTVIDLSNGNISTLDQVAKGYPLKQVDDGEPTQNYLILRNKHMDVAKATKWWNSLRRIDYQGVTYTMIRGSESLTGVDFSGLGLSSQNHRMYDLTWDPDAKIVVPVTNAAQEDSVMTPLPEFDWDMPMGLELMDE